MRVCVFFFCFFLFFFLFVCLFVGLFLCSLPPLPVLWGCMCMCGCVCVYMCMCVCICICVCVYTHTSFFLSSSSLLYLIFLIQIPSNPGQADTPPGRRTTTPWITTSTPPTSYLPAASRLNHHHLPTYLRRHPHWQSTWTLICDKLDPKRLFYRVVNFIFIPANGHERDGTLRAQNLLFL